MLQTIGLLTACLPAVGTVLPLKSPLRVPTGVVVQVFSPARNDAEFRGCDADTCRVMLHARRQGPNGWQPVPFDERGFGPVVELPRELLARTVRLPTCQPDPAPPAPAPRRRRRVVRAAIPVAPPSAQQRSTEQPETHPSNTPPRPPTWADRAPFAPPPHVLSARATPHAPDAPPGLDLSTPTAPVEAPAQVGPFVTSGGRVSGEILPDGRVRFDPPPIVTLEAAGPDLAPRSPLDAPRLLGVGGRGEGLNALDGADIYAREKRLFLERTAPERAAMRAAARRQALVDHQALYAACDAAMRLDGAARRARLFALWDEVSQAPLPDATASTRSVRAYLERRIRAELPRDAGGYPLDELMRLNRCRPPPLFDPYAELETAPPCPR